MLCCCEDFNQTKKKKKNVKRNFFLHYVENNVWLPIFIFRSIPQALPWDSLTRFIFYLACSLDFRGTAITLATDFVKIYSLTPTFSYLIWQFNKKGMHVSQIPTKEYFSDSKREVHHLYVGSVQQQQKKRVHKVYFCRLARRRWNWLLI